MPINLITQLVRVTLIWLFFREKYEEGAEDRNKLVEDRVEKAQDWIRREINKLKAWIKKLGKPDEKVTMLMFYPLYLYMNFYA